MVDFQDVESLYVKYFIYCKHKHLNERIFK